MRRRSLTLSLLAGFLAAGTGCVMPDELSQLQKDMADVQQQLRRIERDQGEARAKLDELEQRSREPDDRLTREDLADVKLQLDQFSRKLEIASDRLNDVDQRMEGFSQELQQTREQASLTPLGPYMPRPDDTEPDAPSGPPSATPDPEALYNTAYADFSKGNFALAVSGFEEYQQRFPDSAFADNALYWIAECHFSQGSFRVAVDALDNLLNRYPDSDKAAAANLKKALAFLEQNQVGQAIVQLQYVASAYEDTDEARLARDKLSSLGASPN